MTPAPITRSLFIGAAALATSGATTVAAAQSARASPAISLQAGAFQYDLSRAAEGASASRGGIGTAPMLALRADFPRSEAVVVEPSLVVARPKQPFGPRTTFVIPEVQLQAQLPFGSIRPYIGAGGGVAIDYRPRESGGARAHFTGSSAAGLRWWLGARAGARAELRLRGIGRDFGRSSSEWTAGLMLRF